MSENGNRELKQCDKNLVDRILPIYQKWESKKISSGIAIEARVAIECLCQNMLLYKGLETLERRSIASTITNLLEHDVVPDTIAACLHAIRKLAIPAAHNILHRNRPVILSSHELRICMELLANVVNWYFIVFLTMQVPDDLQRTPQMDTEKLLNYVEKKFRKQRTVLLLSLAAIVSVIAIGFGAIYISQSKTPLEEFRIELAETDLSTLSAIRPIAHLDTTTTSREAVFTNQSDYCFAANEDLINLIQDLKTRYHEGQPHRGVTCVSAPAGVGKSTLLRMLERADYLPEELTYKIVLEDLQQRFGAELRPELSISSGFNFVFSRLPAFIDNNAPSLVSLFSAYNIDLENNYRPFLIIDSIDEIHPTSAMLLLENIQNDIGAFSSAEFIHLFVMGRADGFRDYFTNPHGENTIPPPLPMHLPSYSSAADMKIGVETSAHYYHRDSAIEPTMALIQQHDFIEESCFVQSLRGEIVKRAERYIEDDVSATRIKDDLFEYMIERNRMTHNRPGLELGAYITALENTAIKYAEIADTLTGYFAVGPLDNIPVSITIDSEVRVGEIAVLDLLCRSGFIDISPLDVTKTKFRFYPSWIHEYLANRSTHDF